MPLLSVRFRTDAAAIALILGAVASAGCTVGPDFVAPKADLPPAWRADAATAPGVAIGTGLLPDWWSSFGDPTLTALIERAAPANPDLQVAALRIAEARAQADIAAAARLPQVDANAGFTRQRISETTATTSLLAGAGAAASGGSSITPAGGVQGGFAGLPNPFNQSQVGFDASWEVDLFGRIRRSVEAARADTVAAVEDRHDALVALDAEVARAYIDLRGAQRRREVLEENLRTQQDALELTRQRRDAGVGNDLDVANAGAQASSTEAQRPVVASRIAQDINQLSFLLGEPPGALRSQLDAAAPVPPVPPQVPIGMPAELVRRRPDIRAAEARLHGATARIGVAVADLFPRLTLNASAGLQAEHVNDLGEWASRFFALGPSLELPIFNGGARRATVRLQDVRAREAAVAYARVVLVALHDVDNALAAYGDEQRRAAALEAAATRSHDALGLARQRFTGGVSSFLDVLDAERNLQQAELAWTDSTTAVSIDLVALYKALGGGWEGAGHDGASSGSDISAGVGGPRTAMPSKE
jgi:outer membrane protein, multidrug efflux system